MPFNRPDISLPPQAAVPATVPAMPPWQPNANQQNHGRLAPEPYTVGVGRSAVEVCTHSQFLDKEYGSTAWCLDCGAEIYVGHASPEGVPWQVRQGGEIMNSSDLSRARHTFHAIWGIGPFKNFPQDYRRLGGYLVLPGNLPPAV